MIILKQDKVNYINKNIVNNLKRGDGLYLSRGSCDYCGRGIYLPRGEGIGDIVSTIFKFINSNKDSIKAITDTASNVVNLASATSKGVTDTIKAAHDIRERSAAQQISGKKGEAITPEALERITTCKVIPKKKKGHESEVPSAQSRGLGFIYY